MIWLKCAINKWAGGAVVVSLGKTLYPPYLQFGPGLYRPMMHQLSSSDDPEQWDMNPSPSLAHTLEAMAKVKRGGRGKKYNLMGQVIPVYGFGILLYILYIMYKVSIDYPLVKIKKALLYSKVLSALHYILISHFKIKPSGSKSEFTYHFKIVV
uniref:Resistance to inhibitors of cholinesterase protein 3 N-terminal domain-containing protein n=1 Tax=Oryzias sinensis TaxID=183150 RepID=A0A8C7WPU7_9TELE